MPVSVAASRPTEVTRAGSSDVEPSADTAERPQSCRYRLRSETALGGCGGNAEGIRRVVATGGRQADGHRAAERIEPEDLQDRGLGLETDDAPQERQIIATISGTMINAHSTGIVFGTVYDSSQNPAPGAVVTVTVAMRASRG